MDNTENLTNTETNEESSLASVSSEQNTPEEIGVDDVINAVESLKGQAEETEDNKEVETEKIEKVEEIEKTEAAETTKEESEQQPKYTESELKAIEAGWKPKNQMKEGEEFYSAEEFLRRGELMQAISKQKRKSDNLEKVISNLTEILKKQGDKINTVEISKVKDARKQAIENGDVKAVEEFDKHIEEVKQLTLQSDQHILNQFAESNAYWFNTNTEKTKEMRQYAINKEMEVRTKNPELPLSLILQEVRSSVEDQYQDFFDIFHGKATPKKTKTEEKKPYVQNFNTVSTGETIKVKTKKKQGFADLPREFKNIVRTMVGFEQPPGADLSKEYDDYANYLFKSGAVE